MIRRTRVVCTLGPATESTEALRALLAQGMNVARLNFSHVRMVHVTQHAKGPKAGDQVVKHEETTVLLIDPRVSALVVSGRMIDGRRTEGDHTEIVLKRRLAA